MVAYALGVVLSAFILYTTLLGELPPIPQRAVPLTLASIMVFLIIPATRVKPAPVWSTPLDLALIAATIATGWYKMRNRIAAEVFDRALQPALSGGRRTMQLNEWCGSPACLTAGPG